MDVGAISALRPQNFRQIQCSAKGNLLTTWTESASHSKTTTVRSKVVARIMTKFRSRTKNFERTVRMLVDG